MANAQSKVMEQYNECYDDYPQDKLVLYIEEIDIDKTSTDMRCFIMFDEYENEYLINGMRKERFVTGVHHTFYCKKRNYLVNYLKSILDPKNELKIKYQYSEASSFNDGLAIVKFKNSHLLIDTKSNIKIKLKKQKIQFLGYELLIIESDKHKNLSDKNLV